MVSQMHNTSTNMFVNSNIGLKTTIVGNWFSNIPIKSFIIRQVKTSDLTFKPVYYKIVYAMCTMSTNISVYISGVVGWCDGAG